ncbi:hypothetical protein JTB14_030826 [Gonioctena quinquepunctata]|nr:hypothetical protein JTB14_030826 [Gonioctena quinquepunctata]
MLAGDINLNILNTSNNNTAQFLYFTEAYGMSIMNNEPTRVTEISSTLIDIIAVTNKNMVVSTHTRNADDISDHCLVYCLLQYKVNKPQPLFKTHRDYKYFVYDDFLDDLRLMPWYDIYQTDDINQIVSLFNTYLLSVFNVHAPVKTVRINISSTLLLSNFHSNSIMCTSTMVSCIVASLFAVVLSSTSNAYVISCPANPIQDQTNPGLRQLCVVLGQAIDDIMSQQTAYSGELGDSNTLSSGKRVDHSFLRIGKRFNL